MKKRIILALLLCLLPLCALSEEAFVVLTSYEEHPAWQEEFEDPHLLRYDNEVYYSFSAETGEPILIKTTDEKHYQLFSDMSWLDAIRLIREKNKAEVEWLSKRSVIPPEANIGFVSYWVRVQLHVPQGFQVGVENFRFRNATDEVWVKSVLEEMDSILGEVWIDDKVPGLESGEYHLRMMARKGVDLKEAIEKAELVCDVTWHPGTQKAFTATVKVLSPYLANMSYDQPVRAEVISARQVPDEQAMQVIKGTDDFWDKMSPYHYLLYMEDYDLWEISARVTKEAGYPLVSFQWKGTGVGGGWVHYNGDVIYDEEMNLAPEETEAEVTFYVVSLQGSTLERQKNYLHSEEVWLEYATEYVGIFDYLYTPGPKYQVKVDMSKVEIVNER